MLMFDRGCTDRQMIFGVAVHQLERHCQESKDSTKLMAVIVFICNMLSNVETFVKVINFRLN